MEKLTNAYKDKLLNNTLIGTPELINTRIEFIGKNNVLYCDENVRIVDSIIRFEGNNCLVFLSNNKNSYYIYHRIYNNSVCCFGKNNYLNGRLNIMLSEEKHFLVGDDGLFSFDSWVRTADPHIVYEANTGKRTNFSKSVFLGDHVWIGQHAMLLKGTQIGSGSIIGAMAVVAGKTVGSNVLYAGNPAKLVSRNVFFTDDCVHAYQKKETEEHAHYEGEEFIYNDKPGEVISFLQIEKALNEIGTSMERLEYLKDFFKRTKKNRFFVME